MYDRKKGMGHSSYYYSKGYYGYYYYNKVKEDEEIEASKELDNLDKDIDKESK